MGQKKGAEIKVLDGRHGPVDHLCGGMWRYRGKNAAGHEIYVCDHNRHAVVRRVTPSTHGQGRHQCGSSCMDVNGFLPVR